MMRVFKRVGATILVVIIIVSISASCFATPVTVTGIDFFTAAFQTFIEICGLTTILSSNGVNSSSNDPYSQLQLTDQYQSLYDEYQTTLSSQESVSDWYDTYKDSIVLNIDSQTSVISPTIDAQLSEWFSGFAGWILEDKYNCTRTESGFSHSSGSFDSPLISSSGMSLNGVTLPQLYNDMVVNISGGNPTPVQFYGFNSTDIFGYFNNGGIYAVSRTPNQSVMLNYWRGYYWYPFTTIYLNYVSNVDGITLYSGSTSVSGSSTDVLPTVNTSGSITYSETSEYISLRPKDKYNEDAIPIPNVESNTYVPEAIEGEYSDVITGSLEGVQNPSLDDVLQAVLDAVTENEEVIAEERVDPAPVNPVMPPFMPFDLPSFDFNLSGIWYYVTRWVNSIGNGVSLFFSIWSNIPPAMFYPVFGSAVVVIVIGVWKRFIA